MLGAARAAVDLAVEHARNREQFGHAIGSFQAVQHMLAWAATDCEALSASAEHGLLFQSIHSDDIGIVVKALAGRNAMSACERSLQVLGAIGFTAEHDHHHFHSRVLALDALLGTRAQLTREIGALWRSDPTDRRLLATTLQVAHFEG
jgi:alkylation response protein AidB-like acyl-CoA dehydrogenase